MRAHKGTAQLNQSAGEVSSLSSVLWSIYGKGKFEPGAEERMKVMMMIGPRKPRKGRTGHAPSEKVAVGVNEISVHQLLQLRNSLFSSCKTCTSNGSHKAALCSLLGTLSGLWTAAA